MIRVTITIRIWMRIRIWLRIRTRLRIRIRILNSMLIKIKISIRSYEFGSELDLQ
jgi:hypothetical protein